MDSLHTHKWQRTLERWFKAPAMDTQAHTLKMYRLFSFFVIWKCTLRSMKKTHTKET